MINYYKVYALLLSVLLSHGQASEELKEDQPEQVAIKPQRHYSYGNFDKLPIEVTCHILSFCKNRKIILSNVSLFMLITGYREDQLMLTGPYTPPPNRQVRLHEEAEMKINFSEFEDNFEKFSSFIWYQFVESVSYLPYRFWLYLKGTKIKAISFEMGYNNHIREIGQCLSNSLITILDLNFYNIDDEKLKVLCPYFKESKLNSVLLCNNQITDKGLKYIIQNLQDTKIFEINLKNNKIENIWSEELRGYLDNIDNCYLELQNNKIDLKDKYLDEIAFMCSKFLINLNYNPISQQQINKLKVKMVQYKDSVFNQQ